jgi:hypothetical protein
VQLCFETVRIFMTIIIDCFTPSQGTIHLLSLTWTGKKCLPFLHLVVQKERCSPIFCCTCLSFFTTKCLVYFCKLINMLSNMCFLLQLKTIVREFSSVFCKPFFAHTHFCLMLLRLRKFASLLSLLLYIECKLSV